ncbi:MAG TPA: GH1 family beta-glucosidase [Candidatus Limnocylindria bacterium]|nr:GH1 family beta-glucosidase [Candidatus Limnocylindria bacterium]
MGFGRDFLWGAATASYQIEGAAEEDGKGLSVWDRFSRTPGKVFEDHTGDVACDHYHRYEEDLALLAGFGIRNYRFSVSWPRLLPEGTGRANEKGLAFYDRLIDAMLEKGVRPLMTLFHWDYPAELLKRGGWENPDSPAWFEEYAALCARRYGDRVKDFIPLNEPQCFIGLGHVAGVHAPGLQVPLAAGIPMAHHALAANGRACRAIRSLVPGARLGYAPCGDVAMPLTGSAQDAEAARKAYFHVPEDPGGWYWNVSWFSDPVLLGAYPQQGLRLYGAHLPKGWEGDMPLIRQELDFYGQNIYNGRPVRAAENALGWEYVNNPPGIARCANGWPVTPECLYWGPRMLYERYRTPILITENGMAGCDAVSLDGEVHDAERVNYLRRYLRELRRAADDGIPIAGYFHWSFLDNFEWAKGYADRFGLVYVDFRTQERIPKDSMRWYAAVIRSNGESL